MRLFAGTPFDRPPRCEHCGELEEACTCPPPAPTWRAAAEQTAKLAVEKRNKGKVVTVVRGLLPTESDLPALLGRLKTACGAGGTLRDELLEIQGRHLDRIRATLIEVGYKVKG